MLLHRTAALFLTVLLVCAQARDGIAAPGRVNSWTTPHVLRIADGANALTNLNPHLSGNAPTVNLSEMTMAWLVKWDANNQPYPELATAVPSRANRGISNDGLSITYHLRKGVRWSDGEPFNGDDVVFTNDLMNNKANNVLGRFDVVSRISEPDKYTVVFHLKKPYSPAIEGFFSSCCANPPILPKHILAKYPNINNVPYNSLPVGIGPFKYQSWGHSKEVVMVANPLYWRGRPKLDKIIYEDVPNTDTALQQLKEQKLDMWYQFAGSYLPSVQALSDVSVYRHPSYAWNHIDFNLAHPIVSDVRVRQALRLSLNRKELVDSLQHGVGVVQDTVTPVAAPYFVDMGTTAYDVGQANALLDQAGWVRGANGIRAKHGVKLALTFATREGSTSLDQLIAFLSDQWKQIGVTLNVQHYPSAKMFAPPAQGGVVFGDNWDLTTFAYAATPTGDYLPYYGCDQFPPIGGNNLRWCNQAAQAAMKAFYGHYDDVQRMADIKVTMNEFVKDVPSIVTLMREDLFAHNNDLKNYRPNSLTIFDNMMDVDI